MRALVQRVKEASCTVDNVLTGEIQLGYVVYIGFKENDKVEDITKLANKILNLRIFSDLEDKMNLNIFDVKGSILLISQFTLYGDASKNNRPSFSQALDYNVAQSYYQILIEVLKPKINLQTGIFGSDMTIKQVNLGPVSILLEY